MRLNQLLAKKKGPGSLQVLGFFEDGWWVLRGSNPRPTPCKGAALPTELSTRRTSETDQFRASLSPLPGRNLGTLAALILSFAHPEATVWHFLGVTQLLPLFYLVLSVWAAWPLDNEDPG